MATQAMKVYTRRQRKDVNHTYWNRMCQTRAAVGQFPSWKQADWWKQQKPKCAYIQSHNHCGKSCGDGARGGVPNPERSWESHLAWASVQFSSVAQSCLTLCNPMNHSTPGLPVHHQLPESTQTHVRWVGDAIQPSHLLSSPSPTEEGILAK